jgi:hypothetical protein
MATLERVPPSKPRRNEDAFIKQLSQSLRATDFEGQVTDIQIRIAVLNRYMALVIPVTEPTG